MARLLPDERRLMLAVERWERGMVTPTGAGEAADAWPERIADEAELE